MVAADHFTEIQNRNELEGAPRARIPSTIVSFMQFSIKKNKQKKRPPGLWIYSQTPGLESECRTQAWNAKNAAPVGKLSTQRTVWALKKGLHAWLYCQLVLWKDVGLWSHIDLTSNPKKHWTVGVGSEKLREGRERSQQRFAIQQVHSVGS